MKLTKETIKRLNKYGRWTYDKNGYAIQPISDTMYEIAEVLINAMVVFECEDHKYTENDGTDEYCIPIINYDDLLDRYTITGTVRSRLARHCLRGIQTRFPKVLSTTFTNGNNGIEIYDVNKLVKIIADEKIA